jgi:SAM-dependent methyltransferase
MAGDQSPTYADAAFQHRIDSYFGRTAAYWEDVYVQRGLRGLIYRVRTETVLDWIDALRLPAGTRVLEVGCGAGVLTVELARRGFVVEATDSSPEMVDLTTRRGVAAGLDVSVSVADAHALPQRGASFDLVVALGVLPWLHSPRRALAELARVLVPGGRAVITSDNRWRLNIFVDPVENPLLAPLKLPMRAVRRRRGWQPQVVSRLYRPSTVDRFLREVGLEPERRATVGVGPFTVFRRRVIPERVGGWVNARLQRLADRGAWAVRNGGWHYIVCARRINRSESTGSSS